MCASSDSGTGSASQKLTISCRTTPAARRCSGAMRCSATKRSSAAVTLGDSQRCRVQRAQVPGAGAAGSVKLKIAPPSGLGSAHNWPPWASMSERLIDRPSPRPLGLVV